MPLFPLLPGWTADDIAIMASQDKCREVIQAYNAQNPQSPRSDVTSPDSLPTSPRQQEPGLGAPALETPGILDETKNQGSQFKQATGVIYLQLWRGQSPAVKCNLSLFIYKLIAIIDVLGLRL